MREYKKRERRQVSFNTEDAVELELLKLADREDINFSGLVKNLLFAYCMGQLQPAKDLSPVKNSRMLSSQNVPPSSFQEIQASGIPFDY